MSNPRDDKHKTGLPPAAGQYLAAAEMDAEGNYNMVGDGIINNERPRRADLTDGQTYDEIAELAPETLPEQEKPSVLDALRHFKDTAAAAPAQDQRPFDDREL